MQSRVHHDQHRRRQAAALITGEADARDAFLSGLMADALLVEDARRCFLAQLRHQGVTGPLFTLAAEDALSAVLRAAFRRLDDLLGWDAGRAPLAAWWGVQALFEFNNDGRRFAERGCGFNHSTGETTALVPDHRPDEAGELQPLPLADEEADPALRFERHNARADLEALLAFAEGHPALPWLREWLEADALDEDDPVVFHGGAARLTWRYGAQRALAARLGVTDRTLRNRTRAVEALLLDLARRVRDL